MVREGFTHASRVTALLVTLLSLVHADTAAAQSVVQGVVRWADGTAAAGVTVTLMRLNAAAVTDSGGRFRFERVPAGARGFEITLGKTKLAEAYALITLAVEIMDIKLNFSAPAVDVPPVATFPGTTESEISAASVVVVTPRFVEEVVVTAPVPMLSTSTDAGRLRLEPEQIEVLPSLGSRDIFRALQLLPGVSSNETSSGLFVRGGTPDQTLVAYDGTTVFNVDHLFGYFSAFNMDAVESVELSKGSYDARQGGRLSSVTEITSKSHAQRMEGTIGGSLLNADGAFAFPLGSRASGMFAARQSFQTPLYNRILGLVNTTQTPQRPAGGPAGGPPGGFAASFSSQPASSFNDFNLRLDATASTHDDLRLSAYLGNDGVDNSRELQLPSGLLDLVRSRGLELPDSLTINDTRDFTNLAGGLAWRHLWGPRATTTTTVSRSTYNAVTDRSANGGGRQGSTGESNGIQDWTLRVDTPIQVWQQEMTVGMEYTKQRANYAFQNAQGAPSGPFNGTATALSSQLNRDTAGDLASAYAQHRLFLGSRLIATPGLRATRYSKIGDLDVEPRLSTTALLTDRLRVKGAWGVYHQYANRLVREDVLQGNREFWALADGQTIPVSRSVNAALGGTYETASLLIDVEAYTRRMSGLSQLVPRVTGSSQGIDLSDYFYRGTGTARGIEVLAQRKVGRHTGWASYTWSRVLYNFPDLGSPFLADHDRTHELKLVDTAVYGPWSVSGTWIYSTGRPYTQPSGTTAFTVDTPIGEQVFERIEVGAKNGSRLPAYHRLDLAANYGWTFADRRKAVAGLSLFNAYNHRNVWYKEFTVVDGEIVQSDINLMNFTVNAYLTIKF